MSVLDQNSFSGKHDIMPSHLALLCEQGLPQRSHSVCIVTPSLGDVSYLQKTVKFCVIKVIYVVDLPNGTM